MDGRGEANEGEYQMKLFLGVKFLVRRERNFFGARMLGRILGPSSGGSRREWTAKRKADKSGYGLSGFSIDFRCRKVG